MSRIDELIEELCPEGVPRRAIGSFAACIVGATPSSGVSDYWDGGDIPWMSSGEVNRKTITYTEKSITQKGFDSSSTKLVPPDSVVIALAGQGKTRGLVAITRIALCTNQSLCAITCDSTVLPDYLFYFLSSRYLELRGLSAGEGGRGGLNLQIIRNYSLPIPPLEVQAEIVSILDKFTQLEAELEAELEARRIQYEVTRDRLLDFSGDLEGHPLQGRIPMEFLENVRLIRLADLVKTQSPAGKIPRSKFLEDGLFPIVDQSQALIAGFTDDESLVNDLEPCVVFGDHTREIKYVDFPFAAGADGTVILLTSGELSARFLFYSLQSLRIQSRGYNRHWSVVKEHEISIPPLVLQDEIVSTLDKLDTLVNDITIGLPAEIAARRKQYEYYRNKLLTFKELEAS